MSVRRLINNDYSFGYGQNDIISGIEACLQKCRTKLMQLAGEWFLDYRDGVRWGDVIGKKTNTNNLSDFISEALLSVDGVIEIISINIDMDVRDAYIISKIKTDFGDVDFNQSFNILEVLANEQVNK